MSDVSLRGPSAAIMSAGPVAPPATATPPPTAAPTPPSDHAPAVQDTARTTEVRTVTGNVKQDFQTLMPATREAFAAFVNTNANLPATAAISTGSNWSIRVGDEAIIVSHTDLTAALKSGRMSGATPFARSLFVAELTASIELPGPAKRAILKAFATAIDSGVPPSRAMQDAQHNAILAVDVERYLGDKEGLASDMRQIGQFTPAAQSGSFAFLNPLASKQKAKQIKDGQATLDKGLIAFTKALGQAHENGNYGAAFDALQNFFETSSQVTHDPYWSGRLETRSQAMSAPILKATQPMDHWTIGQSLMVAASEGMTARTALKSLELPFITRERAVTGQHPVDLSNKVQSTSIGGEQIEVHRKMWLGKQGAASDKNADFTQYLTGEQSNKHSVTGGLVTTDPNGRQNVALRAQAYVDASNPQGLVRPSGV
ncbi:MAG: hypothetical protein H7338_22810, partial [Candidatus Sericytochromatia bacterium]|nr:hypothetical protein [Candidatus Sericytochromatia bacterium]